jgi:DNA primase
VVSARGDASPLPRRAIDDALRSIAAEEYAFVLTGRRANRQGKIACPFHHPDRTPSLQLYPDGTWFCFGCRRGGSIYDFAAAVWNTTTKSSDFLALRTRLAERFRVAPARTHA